MLLLKYGFCKGHLSSITINEAVLLQVHVVAEISAPRL